MSKYEEAIVSRLGRDHTTACVLNGGPIKNTGIPSEIDAIYTFNGKVNALGLFKDVNFDTLDVTAQAQIVEKIENKEYVVDPSY